jgi:hypothetical protein
MRYFAAIKSLGHSSCPFPAILTPESIFRASSLPTLTSIPNCAARINYSSSANPIINNMNTSVNTPGVQDSKMSSWFSPLASRTTN